MSIIAVVGTIVPVIAGIIEIRMAICEDEKKLSDWARKRIRPAISLCAAVGSNTLLHYVVANFSHAPVRKFAQTVSCMGNPGTKYLLMHITKNSTASVCFAQAMILLPLCASTVFSWELLYSRREYGQKQVICDICRCVIYASYLVTFAVAGSLYGLPKSALLNFESCLPKSVWCWSFAVGSFFCYIALNRTSGKISENVRRKSEKPEEKRQK